MATYNIHAGHGLSGGIGCGAAGLLDESAENRKVKNKLIELLKSAGHTAYDCTVDKNISANSILSEIVKKCNSHAVDMDISIHLNSGRADAIGDGKTGGVEVLGYSNDVAGIAENICKGISAALGITNRGFKIRQDLYVLRNTKAKAILIECCFVDDRDDKDRWNPEKCAEVIFAALTGQAAGTIPPNAGAAAKKEQASVQLYAVNGTDAQRWKVHHNKDGTILLQNAACGLYLDVAGGNTADGTTVGVYKKGNGKNQKWRLEQQKGSYSPEFLRPVLLVSALNRNMCLDVTGAGRDNGTRIDIYRKNNTAAQQWGILDHGDGTWTIINTGSCKALDVAGGGK